MHSIRHRHSISTTCSIILLQSSVATGFTTPTNMRFATPMQLRASRIQDDPELFSRAPWFHAAHLDNEFLLHTYTDVQGNFPGGVNLSMTRSFEWRNRVAMYESDFVRFRRRWHMGRWYGNPIANGIRRSWIEAIAARLKTRGGSIISKWTEMGFVACS